MRLQYEEAPVVRPLLPGIGALNILERQTTGARRASRFNNRLRKMAQNGLKALQISHIFE
jgi:hypothetical protein